MSSENVRLLESRLEAIAVTLVDVLEWKWDSRFDTALAEFSADRADEVLVLLEKHLPFTWDQAQVAEAPGGVQYVVRKLGGLMPGQRLLVSDRESAAFIFCAWWPWGSGQRISIRVGAGGEGVSTDEASGLTGFLRGLLKA